MRKRIGVLFGGRSPEYPVSLESASSVLRFMDREKYEPVMLGLTREGKWYHFTGDPERIPADSWCAPDCCAPVYAALDRFPGALMEVTPAGPAVLPLDATFPVLHGQNGEDGTVQGLLELLGIPVVGCGCLPSALAMDKLRAHDLARAAGVPVPRGGMLGPNDGTERAEALAAGLGWPVFVKPIRAGSSFGISRVESPAALPEAVALARRYDSRILLEEMVRGVELGCAVLGNDALTVGGPDMIQLAGSSAFFDYKEKYTLETAEILLPAPVDPETAEAAREMAKTVYRALGCRGFARVDLFLTEDGKLMFNEVNTIPGFTSHSRYPNMLKQIGISFPEVIDRALKLSEEP